MNADIVDASERNRFVATFKTVRNISEVARRHRRSYKTVARHLQAAGIEFGPRRLDTDRKKKIVTLYSGGMSLREVAAAEHLAYGTVHAVISAAGIMRRRGNPAVRARRPGAHYTSAGSGEPADPPEAVARAG